MLDSYVQKSGETFVKLSRTYIRVTVTAPETQNILFLTKKNLKENISVNQIELLINYR